MIHPNTELRYVNDTIGYGVFVTAFIPKGTIVWVQDDLDIELAHHQVLQMPEKLQQEIEKYAYLNNRGQYILCWDLGRFMNHSCEPNTRSLGTMGDIAIRDIHPDDELTCEYSTCLTPPFECFCQSLKCRKIIKAEDIDRFWEEWDRDMHGALALARGVHQPIIPCIKKDGGNQAFIRSLMAGENVAFPSHRDLRPIFN